MSEMHISMRLSLADAASGPLAKFMEQVKGLDAAITSINRKFSGFTRGADRVSGAATGTGTNLARLDRMVQMMVASLGQAQGQLAATAAVLGQTATNARAAGNATAAAAGQMNRAAAGVGNMRNQVTGLNGALRGMAGLWAALKLEKGFKASGNEAIQYQITQAKLQALNLPASQNRYAEQQSFKTSQQLGFVSERQALESRYAMITALKVNNEQLLNKIMPAVLKSAEVMRVRGGDKNVVADIVRNIMSIAELRGQTHDAAGIQRTAELMQKIQATTNLKMADIELVSRQIKFGAMSQLSDQGLMRLMAYANELKVAGHGGGGGGGRGVSQAGTAITQVTKWAQGGVLNKQSAFLLQQMGMLPSSSISGDSNTTNVNVAGGQLRNQSLAAHDPLKWLEKMTPYMLAYVKAHRKQFFQGADVNNRTAQEAALQKLSILLTGTVNLGNMVAMMSNPRTLAYVNESTSMISHAQNTDQSMAELNKTAALNIDKYHAAMKSLERELGARFLPALTSLIKLATRAAEALARFAHNHPTITAIAEMAAGILGLGVAIRSLMLIFGFAGGVFRPFWTILKSVGGAFISGASAALRFANKVAIASGGVSRLKALLLDSRFIAALGALGGAALMLYSPALNQGEATWDANRQAKLHPSLKGAIPGTRQYAWLQIQERLKGLNPAQRALVMSSPDVQSLATEFSVHKPISSPNGAVETSKEMNAAAAKVKLPPQKNYNTDLSGLRARISAERSILQIHMQALDNQYRHDKVSISDYYAQKAKIIKEGVQNELALLHQERNAAIKPSDITKANAKISVLMQKSKAQAAGIELDKEKALQALKREGLSLDEKIGSLEGTTAASRIASLNFELDLEKKKLQLNGQHATVVKLEHYRQLATAHAKFAEGVQHINDLMSAEQIKERELTAAVRAGAMTQAQADERRIALQQDLGQAMLHNLAIMKQSATTTRDKQTLASYFVNANEKAKQFGATALQVKNVMQGAFANAFDSLGRHAKSFRDIMKQLFTDISDGITRIVSQRLSESLTNSLFGKATGQGGGTGAVGQVFNGGNILSNVWGAISNMVPAFASGTDYVPQDMLAYVHRGEKITPASQNRPGVMGGLNQYFHIHGHSADNHTQQQIGLKAYQGMMLANKRNG